jgi:dTDP-4-dehydrorhamnose reductase
MKPTVLITGGSGLLAINWALAMRSQYSVVLGTHKRGIDLAEVTAFQIDLENVNQLVRALEVIKPHIVIHTAGLTNVDDCEARPELARHINVDLAENVAQACAELGLLLIHISTDHLFSGETPFLDELHPVAPVNVYGRTKAEAELRVIEAHPQTLVIRTNFYGWGPSYRRSFSDMVLEALRTGKDVTLFTDVFYTPILAEAVITAVHDLIGLKARGIYHIVGDERISKYEFGINIVEEFGFDSSKIKAGLICEHSSLVKRPLDMSLSNRKASKLLGRKLGGVVEQIERLHQQEKIGLAQEIQNL